MSFLQYNNSKPFLRWAGGKSWLTKHLYNIRIGEYQNYHEPFLGGAATFFYLNPDRSYLSDMNIDLVNTYLAVRDEARLVIEALETFTNTESFYYEIRSKVFESSAEKAAKFIYLNQTSFNGIYRVNLKGVYNVPFGFRKKNFLDRHTILSAQTALQGTEIFESDFYSTLDNINERDLVFLDPPYTVSHNENGFIKYNEKLFSYDDQIRLSDMINKIRERGAFYILTNAAHPIVEEIFGNGDRILRLNRANLIGGFNAGRGQTSELIFTNTNL
ncbi:DNA adenine methylase [Dyadobacter chenhuakuii]|uniref:site-specific DNA-methyltransferase (adenine-specific) n=1 Tax=Dyadobacter chenhuakuii TaxID=2909339 RepID=A0A9X1Q9J3_9BACT|nr:Dam family site-specific DNA-(adenine-N6)-methyltransferase [Dyadobacter chenhuakuii]MCF2497640.1 Dam family site-specific DNA-(adenine-N6)-methyltransferase [Dyadobacter chenhuakuii]